MVALLIGHGELRGLAGLSRYSPPYLGLVLLIGCLPVFGWEVRNPGSERHFALVEGTAGAAFCLAMAGLGVVAAVAIARGARGLIVAEIASLWIAAPLASILTLKLPYNLSLPVFDFATPVLLCLVPIWVGDTLAIFAGRAFGKHLLAPKISPKKTVEGGIANLLGCIGAAIGLSLLLDQPILVGLLAGLATGTLGQVGDLLESAMKRSADLKDSGALLPGHGGLLDRIDSILLSAPAVALIVALLGNNFATIGMTTG